MECCPHIRRGLIALLLAAPLLIAALSCSNNSNTGSPSSPNKNTPVSSSQEPRTDPR
jgi:hypothetical protein